MTVLLVSPDYLSHYLPMSAVGDALRDDGREVVFATGAGLRERVVADGFDHVELRLGAGSNAKAETEGDDPGLSAFIAATREGMVATLELQARRRVDDLLWEPERVTVRLAEIVDDVRPELVLSDQLAFGAGLALRAIRVPFASFLPGHPSQMPQLGMPFGFPGRRPPGFEPDDLAGLYALCAWTARAFTRRFNRTLLDLDPDATPVADAFAEEAPSGTIVNYPASLAGRWPTGGTLVGACGRDEPGDPELDALHRGGDPPRAYVALGSFLSARSDVLRRIAEGLRTAGFQAVIASGVTPPEELGPLPQGWIVRRRLPQIAALRACDVVICHGGNNTVMEALQAGLPVVALPFSTDQFAVAADLESGGLGEALDPNRATAQDLVAAMRAAVGFGPRARAAKLGRALRRDPGAERAKRILVGLAGRRSESGRTRIRRACTTTRTAASWDSRAESPPTLPVA